MSVGPSTQSHSHLERNFRSRLEFSDLAFTFKHNLTVSFAEQGDAGSGSGMTLVVGWLHVVFGSFVIRRKRSAHSAG